MRPKERVVRERLELGHEGREDERYAERAGRQARARDPCAAHAHRDPDRERGRQPDGFSRGMHARTLARRVALRDLAGSRGFQLERAGGVEPPTTAWKAVVIPLHHARAVRRSEYRYCGGPLVGVIVPVCGSPVGSVQAIGTGLPGTRMRTALRTSELDEI